VSIIKKDCFMFSVELAVTEAWDELYNWLSHFERTGTPAGLVIDGGMVSVWRTGRRKGAGGSETDLPKGILHIQVNKFGKTWLAHGGSIASSYDKRIRR
jgi:hypothetical protein